MLVDDRPLSEEIQGISSVVAAGEFARLLTEQRR
jgi:hypothetical protein